jgi:hypothetical protein
MLCFRAQASFSALRRLVHLLFALSFERGVVFIVFESPRQRSRLISFRKCATLNVLYPCYYLLLQTLVISCDYKMACEVGKLRAYCLCILHCKIFWISLLALINLSNPETCPSHMQNVNTQTNKQCCWQHQCRARSQATNSHVLRTKSLTP